MVGGLRFEGHGLGAGESKQEDGPSNVVEAREWIRDWRARWVLLNQLKA